MLTLSGRTLFPRPGTTVPGRGRLLLLGLVLGQRRRQVLHLQAFLLGAGNRDRVTRHGNGEILLGDVGQLFLPLVFRKHRVLAGFEVHAAPMTASGPVVVVGIPATAVIGVWIVLRRVVVDAVIAVLRLGVGVVAVVIVVVGVVSPLRVVGIRTTLG